MKLFFVLIAAAACLLVATGGCQIEFHTFTSHDGVPDKAPEDSSAEVKDAFALRSAGASTHADETAVQMSDLLDQATAQGARDGGALLRSQFPPLYDQFESDLPLLVDRIRRTNVKTASGFTCRDSVVRLVARENRLYGRLDRQIRAGRPWRAVDRFAAGYARLSRWWSAQLNRCIGVAPAEDRDAIQVVLRSF